MDGEWEGNVAKRGGIGVGIGASRRHVGAGRGQIPVPRALVYPLAATQTCPGPFDHLDLCQPKNGCRSKLNQSPQAI